MPSSGSGTGTPIAGGTPSGLSVAQPLPHTLLSLPRWARIMSVNPVHFAGGYGTTVWARFSGRCDDVWPRHNWQCPEHVSHEDLAYAIKGAEEDMAEALGFFPAPMWIAQEIRMYPRHYRPDAIRVSGSDVRDYGAGVQTRFGRIVQAGQRAVSKVGTAQTSDGSLNYTDEDGDGFAETATVTVSTTLTDEDEVKVYFYDCDGLQEWEIRPPRSKSIGGGTFTAVFDSWLFIDPDTLTYYPTLSLGGNTNECQGVNVTDTTNYVARVDVYREYTDSTGTSATFYWEPRGRNEVSSICSVCSGTGCPACEFTTQDGCIHIRDAERGFVVPTAATYSSTTEEWSTVPLTQCRDPDFVKIYYYAGDTSNKWRGGFGTYNEALSDRWAQAIAWMAVARLENEICNCGNIEEVARKLRTDLALVGAESYNIPFSLMENPFGTRLGEVRAWQRVSECRDRIPTVALI